MYFPTCCSELRSWKGDLGNLIGLSLVAEIELSCLFYSVLQYSSSLVLQYSGIAVI